jgi:His-Xaa-Ser repeat protein HxsA
LNSAPPLTNAEKLKLQVMRVQIKLTTLGLYQGKVDGALNEQTKASLRQFQLLKRLPESGLMTTPTLNALGVTSGSR